jgi:nicotinamide riboside kinase
MSAQAIKIVVITGPECSGKTTLARNLAQNLNEPWVPEYAREYLSNLNRPYYAEDLIEILRGQLRAIESALPKAKKWLLVDTGPEVIQIWHRDKFGTEPPELTALAAVFKPTMYLLCKPDIPYVPDPLREDPFRRDELFERYLELLHKDVVKVVGGSEEKRLKDSVNHLMSTVL